MIDLDILKRKGLTEENLKKWLSVDPLNPPLDTENEKKIAALLRRIRSRQQEGMDRNFREYKTYYALDLCWDTPFRQITPTLVQSFIGKNPNEKEVYEALQNWGYTNLVTESTEAKTGEKIKTFNWPVFNNVFVPLVKAYVTIRWAKIMNDRDVHPFIKYEPIKKTLPLSLKCEVLTDRIQVMSNQMGYYDAVKQSVLKMLLYGVCFQFPKEEWHSEYQLKMSDEMDVAMGRATEPDKEIKVTAIEGIRYHSPHPTRVYRDLAHAAAAYNYDSGPEFSGYWRIARWSEIDRGKFWNRDKVTYGDGDLISNHRLFFTSVYTSATMTMPTCVSSVADLGLGAGAMDREKELVNQYYGTEHGDQGVLIGEHFEKLVPKDNGLGDYEYPVWFRFVTAGASGTILYAAPLPYAPVIYYGYDEDSSRTQSSGQGLEVLPFQDHFSNVMTQIITTAKQNLANVTFIDTDQMDPETQAKLQNMGEQTYRFLNIFGFSTKKMNRQMQGKIPDPVHSATLPKGNVAELQSVLRQILEVLERVLVMSSQEVAQAASHELRADEVRNIAQSTSTRLTFTGKPVDLANDAMKRQLYQGLMAYGDPYIYAEIPSDSPLDIPTLQAMGFTFHKPGRTSVGIKDPYMAAIIKKDRTAMDLWQFASTKNEQDRTDNVVMAQALAQIVQTLMANPITAQAIGAEQAITLTNEIARMVGMRRDLKLRNVTPPVDPEQAKMEAQAQLKQVVDTILQQVEATVKPIVETNTQQSAQLDLIFKALGLANLLKSPTNDPDSTSAPTGY